MSAIGGPASGAELGWVSRDCDPKIRCLKGVYVFVVTVEARPRIFGEYRRLNKSRMVVSGCSGSLEGLGKQAQA